MALISIIVPVYNTEKYIERCIESILQQTFSDYNLFLVDDGSTDRGGEICDEYACRDNRIHVIHQKNLGPSAARNTGIEWGLKDSDNKWFAFVDSDDWIHPQYLEILLSAAEQNDVLISVCGIMRVDKKEPMEKISCSSYIKKSETLYLDYARKIVNVSACGKLYNKKCFESIRYPIGKQWEDLATTYKLILAVPYCSVIDEALYYYFNNPEGIVKRFWSPRRLDEFVAYETQLKFFEQDEKWKEIFEALQLSYIRAISYSYFMLRDSLMPAKEKKYYGRILSKKMKKALASYKGKLKFVENLGIYETAYPLIVDLFWRIRSALNKLKKK